MALHKEIRDSQGRIIWEEVNPQRPKKNTRQLKLGEKMRKIKQTELKE